MSETLSLPGGAPVDLPEGFSEIVIPGTKMLVRRVDPTRTRGGLLLPADRRVTHNLCEVLLVGDYVDDEGVVHEPRVRVGDHVMVVPAAVLAIQLEDQVFAVVEECFVTVILR